MERWVKATPVSAPDEAVWINIPDHGRITAWDNGGSMIGGDVFREPPEHFLPHSAIALERAMYFIGHVCSIPEDAASGDGLVREAKRIRDQIIALA